MAPGGIPLIQSAADVRSLREKEKVLSPGNEPYGYGS